MSIFFNPREQADHSLHAAEEARAAARAKFRASDAIPLNSTQSEREQVEGIKLRDPLIRIANTLLELAQIIAPPDPASREN